MKKSVLFILLFFTLATWAQASPVTMQFNTGDSLEAWHVDRKEPANFAIVDNELHLSISKGTQDEKGNYDTQGMNLDIGKASSFSIDVFIDSKWQYVIDNNTDPIAPTYDTTRYAGAWAYVVSSYWDLTPDWPVIEYQVAPDNNGGIYEWVYNGWLNDESTKFELDAFNTFKMAIVDDGALAYYVNGIEIYRDTESHADYLSKIFLNGKANGTPYTVRYDNLSYSPVPEPTTWALMASGLLFLFFFRTKSHN